MSKVIKTYVELSDIDGEIWFSGEFTPATIKRLVNAYKRAGIYLSLTSEKVAA